MMLRKCHPGMFTIMDTGQTDQSGGGKDLYQEKPIKICLRIPSSIFMIECLKCSFFNLSINLPAEIKLKNYLAFFK